ncbi:MAG: peptidoglycan DD-metalloendopeptidase family protein [Pseudomonadota bacterium]
MPILRKRLLPALSLSLAAMAAVAVGLDAAQAQSSPTVRYGTDPNREPVGSPQYLSYSNADAPAHTGEMMHTVMAGDTIYGISRQYGIAPASIIQKNGLAAPYGLTVGQSLIVPMGGSAHLASQQASLGRQAVPAVPTPAQPQSQRQSFDLNGVHVVRHGDTLYSLSRAYGASVPDLAAVNRLQPPYTLAVGQQIVIPGAANQVARSRQQVPSQRSLEAKMIEETVLPRTSAAAARAARFAWPLRGSVVAEFGDLQDGMRNDGLNIAAPMGSPVRATADGEVVYRGSELDGYGNLLLIKHDSGWVSAYAHTDAILVRKGDFVRQGQVVAKVGRSGSVSSPQLHFQLRRDLQPQDPRMALAGGQSADQLTLRR